MTAKNKHELAEEYSNSQDDHYPNLPYKQMEKEAWLSGYESLEARLESAEAVIKEAEKYCDTGCVEQKHGPGNLSWIISEYLEKHR